MAGVTPDARDGRSGNAPAPGREPDDGAAASRPVAERVVPAVAATPPNDGAVRVRLAAASRLVDDVPLRVAPVPRPLRMSNPTLGVGPLGGPALPDAEPPDPAVLAQRQVLVDDEPVLATLRPAGHDRHVLDAGGERTMIVLGPAHAIPSGAAVREVLVGGYRFEVEVESERIASLRERATRGRAASAHGGRLDVRAIIPGKVVSVSVAQGDAVIAGQQLLVVEAMKMQNELRAPRDGTIDTVAVAPGVNIEVGDLLVVIS